MSPGRKYIPLALGLAVTGVCLFLLTKTLRFEDVLFQLSRVDVGFLILFLPVFAVNMVCRTLRWQILIGLNNRIPFATVFSALLIGNFYNAIFPARAGDVIRALFFSTKTNLRKIQVLASVVVERLLDFCFLMVLAFALAHILELGKPYTGRSWYILGGGILFLLAVVILAQKKYWRVVERLLVARISPSLHAKLRDMAHAFVEGVTPLFAARAFLLFIPAFFAVWFLESVSLWVIVHACGESVEFTKIAALFLFPTFAALLPGAPGQIGIFEYAVVVGAGVLDIGSGAAIAIVWHSTSLFCIIVFGLIALLLNLNFLRQKKRLRHEKGC